MRVLFALPGLHRYHRGAEVAFISVAEELAKAGEKVTLIGSGRGDPAKPYRFIRAPSVGREWFESFPRFPALRNETAYEELTFVPGLLHRYRPNEYDVTLSCSYPFTNWVLRRPVLRGRRPPHIFVTENGDWPAFVSKAEYRFFGCEGLVCTNPEFYERNKGQWHSKLIPNGVDCHRFFPAPGVREKFGLPGDRLVVLMVSALDQNKRVEMGIHAVSQVSNSHLVVAGDGPLRQTIDGTAAKILPGRYTRLKVPPEQMPDLYRSADIFLHLSTEESFGNVYLEAMASGLPIVAHDSSRLRWVVGDNEYLVDTNDRVAIAHSIERARKGSPTFRTLRVDRAKTFSWSKIAAMYRDFFNELLQQ